jgi:peroxiredoxin
VEIFGDAHFFRNEKLSVSVYSNLLTKTTTPIAETIISDSGDYQISFRIKKPQEIVIKIEMREISIPVFPGDTININFLAIENAENQRIPFRVSVKPLNVNPNIANFEVYQNLEISFASHQSNITKGTNLSSFYQVFFDSIEIAYAGYLKEDHLFRIHFEYFKANAYLQTEQSNRDLYRQYITNSPVQYTSQEYLKFFKAIALRSIHHLLSKNSTEVEKASNEYQIYDAFISLIATDTLFQTEEEQSLILLLYCLNNESNPIISRSLKNGILNQMSNFCPYPEQKKAALIYQSKNNIFDEGNEAPEFTLPNSKGNQVKLSDYRGRITYLGFIHSKSRTCVKDLQVVDNIKRKYRKAQFIFVICDRDSLKMDQLPAESNSIHYLFLNKEYAVLEKYQVRNFPVYYLLDKHGYFIQSPAKNPEGIIDDFQIIFAPRSHRKSYEIIKD